MNPEEIPWVPDESELSDLRQDMQTALEDDGLMPTGGFSIESFPQIVVALRPYVTDSRLRPDPSIRISDEDVLLMDVGNVQIALPNEEEWLKLVDMVGRVWKSHRARLKGQEDAG